MRIAILDPAAGISGDMTLGALLALGVSEAWLTRLPARLGLAGVGVTLISPDRLLSTRSQITAGTLRFNDVALAEYRVSVGGLPEGAVQNINLQIVDVKP